MAERQTNGVSGLVGVLLLLLLSTHAAAYSYSEAGKEPLIEGREALIGALLAKDAKLARSTLTLLGPELDELEKSMSVELMAPLTEAVKNNQRSDAIKLMNRAFASEIKRRISLAETNMHDYQKSKILVAKSKRFLDMLIVELDDDDAEQAEQSIKQCLKALGNPGIFGAGMVPADPERYRAAKQRLYESLSLFE